jgi:hypothetical protein
VRHAKDPQNTESNPNTTESKKDALARQFVISNFWTSRLMEKPNVATEKVKNKLMHKESCVMRNPYQRL